MELVPAVPPLVLLTGLMHHRHPISWMHSLHVSLDLQLLVESPEINFAVKKSKNSTFSGTIVVRMTQEEIRMISCGE